MIPQIRVHEKNITETVDICSFEMSALLRSEENAPHTRDILDSAHMYALVRESDILKALVRQSACKHRIVIWHCNRLRSSI